MERLKFDQFTWLENPEEFRIGAITEPLYQIEADGTMHYQGLGPLCRVITGKGVFQGSTAVKYFNALAVKMGTKAMGTLIHPIWGNFQVYLVELNMKQTSRVDFIEYDFVFREANADGMIPKLPEEKE